MIINELGVKEVNEYYARMGGKRTVNINNFANFMEKASLRRSAAAQSTASVTENSKAEADQDSAQSAEKTENTKACCEQCRLTSQLMLQMMSRSLYSQSGMGFSLAGTGALSSYQNMLNALSNSILS